MIFSVNLRVATFVIMALLMTALPSILAQEFMTEDQLDGQIYAPEFPIGLDWLNTLQPVTMQQLHGKIVLINFWSSSSPDCFEVMPELQKLQEKYARELIVVGVHSPAFANEKDSDVIRHAILSHEIKQPVINDSGMQIWNEYGLASRPSFVLVNPSGRVIGVHSGTDVYDLFDGIIAQAVTHFDADSLIGRHQINFIPEAYRQEKTLLGYPGKISSDTSGTRLYFSDSGNHRILATTTSGKIEFVIGSGHRGNRDGSFAQAQFQRPQGLALAGDILYIADSENGTIRAANLKTKEVSTILDGATADNLPWDLTVLDGKLYVAMTGANQIWVADLKTLELQAYAGSGQRGHRDGPVMDAELAQPTGITTDGRKLYFVDSGSNSVRAIDPNAGGQVETVIGGDLNESDVLDGNPETARLQNPQGITCHDGLLYIADCYNQQIKIVDPVKKTLTNYAGTGRRGVQDGELAAAEFREPTGLVFAGAKLFVADCNNQQIRIIDTKAQQISSVQFTNLGITAKQTVANFEGKEMKLPPAKLKSGSAKISIALIIPDGFKMLEQGAFFVNFRSSDNKVISFTATPQEITLNQVTGEFEIPINGVVGTANVTIEIVVYMHKEGSAACFYDMIHANVPVTIEEKGSAGFGVGVKVSALPRM